METTVSKLERQIEERLRAYQNMNPLILIIG